MAGLGMLWDPPGNLDKVAEEREDRWMDEWLKTDVFFENLGKTYGLRTSDSCFLLTSNNGTVLKIDSTPIFVFSCASLSLFVQLCSL